MNLALAEIFKLVDAANKYIDETTPWILGKQEESKARLATVLYNLLECIRISSTLLNSFMPTTMPVVWERIGLKAEYATYENVQKFGVLPLNVTVVADDAIFPRIDMEKEIEELNAIMAANAPKTEEKKEIVGLAEIQFDDFAKVEIRVCKVTDCQPIKKAKKLLELTLDDGTDTPRTVASGIAKWYKPEDLIGKSVLVVANLAPRTLCGVESHGMILAGEISEEDVKVVFVEGLPAGTQLG